ncbi:hypothetical protein EZV62_015599 [Acer yangbiense]|uniref:Steroid 5-alpha reductase C-terminal domain-containing protein n=1 Tax=Acer yangbiense TaxID=1000413 RepID=A0A5C7HL67_9ROSI|nr:hypothetical protein EZV62_015599 [Acer yangbiense]
MDLGILLHALTPSLDSVAILVTFFTYLAIFGSILPGKVVQGVVISHRGLELLSTTFIFSVLVTLVLYAAGRRSHNQGSSLKAHITGNVIHDWWFGIQLNPWFLGIDLKFFFVRAGMMGWLLINLSILAKSVLDGLLSRSMILYQAFSTGWWLLHNKVELTTAAVIANCIVFLIGYLVFRGANKQKHMFKKNPKALIWVSLLGGMARHCNYLGDLLLALSFSLPCGISSPIPYFYPIYLLILLIWRERRDEARCAEKYREVWAEYCRLVPWRILPYFY